MKNFIAFRFNDNDFHYQLDAAIKHIVKNAYEDLTLESWTEFAIRGTLAFGMIRRVDNWSAGFPVVDYRTYISETLKVTEVNTLDELDDSFEGYIFDTNLRTVNYYG